MPTPSENHDPFSAIAEPRRREILESLSGGELPVGAIVTRLSIDQPTVSKHLRVLREAGLVHVRKEGRRRLYRVNGVGVRRLHDWTAMFDRYWTDQLDAIKRLAETRATSLDTPDTSSMKDSP